MWQGGPEPFEINVQSNEAIKEIKKVAEASVF